MTHPPVEELLGGGDAAREHLDACPACRRVVALADDPTAPRAPAPREEFPAEVIDRARYTEWTALGAGGGGMGHLFRAFDARLGREVVIKQPRGSELRARFEREALMTARLQHPAIVGVYEAGRFAGGEPFYAMPLVRGAPLSDEIARHATVEERFALLPHVAAVCEAVAYAHEQGIVHRDLKPANVLVGSFGETVVIDWGLATDVAARDTAPPSVSLDEVGDGLTQLGVGTANYMPPEQALGAAADARMDVYALGATLYHTLAGTPPYGSLETAKVRPRLLVEPPAPLATVAPSIAPALCDIVARAMAREPADRFATARELAEELRRFQTGRLVLTRRYTPGEILRHYARRYRAPLAVAGVAAALLAGVAVVSAVRVTRAGNAAQVAKQRALANERASRTELRRGMGFAASRLALEPTRRAQALALAVDAIAPALAAGEPPVDEARQGLHDSIGGAAAVVLEGHSAALGAFAFSPDGSRLVGLSRRDHSIHLWDGRSGKHLGTVASGGAQFAVDELAFSPDGTRLLTWARTPAQAQLWPIGTGALPLTLDPHVVALVPAATRIHARVDGGGVWTARPGRIELIDRETEAPLRTLEGPPGLAIEAFAVAPGPRIAVATESAAWLVDARAPEAGAFVGHSSEVTGLVDAGGRLLSAGLDGRVLAWRGDGARTGAARIESEIVAMAGARDRVVVGGIDGVAHIFAIDGAGRLSNGGSLIAAGLAISALAISPDGHRIAIAQTDGGLVVVDPDAIASGAGGPLRDTNAQPIAALAFSPDGSRLAAVDVTSRVELWEPATGRLVAQHALPAADDNDRSMFAIAFAGPARLLVGRFGGDTAILSLPTLAADGTIEGRVVALSDDGRRIVAAGLNGAVVVHDAGASPRQIAIAARPLTTAALSSDGGTLALGDADGLVRVHDLAAAGRAALELSGTGAGAVSALRFSADGRHLAVGHASGVLRLHPLQPADALARACATLALLDRAPPACATASPRARAP